MTQLPNSGTGADYPQVGVGWAYPPRWSAEPEQPAVVALNDGATHVKEAMVILLRTAVGSRAMRPELGAGVDRHVFEPRTAESCHRLADDVRRALVLGEPRIIVDHVEAVPSPTADEQVDVTIEFRIDRHRRPTSLVVPFYLVGAS